MTLRLCVFCFDSFYIIKMDLDGDRLVVLVQARPALYDYTMKEYSNKDVIDHLWDEIGKEMNATASNCRLKWHNLRSSYTRYLRGVKKQPCGSGSSKKKKWFMANAMSFLDNYVNHHKKTASKCTEEEDSEAVTSDRDSYEDSTPCNSILHSVPTSFQSYSSNQQLKPSPQGGELLAVPVTKFVQTVAESRGVNESDSPLIHFFRGLLPDIEKLMPKRQRTFRVELVQLVNRLVDEEEEDNVQITRAKAASISAATSSGSVTEPQGINEEEEPVDNVADTRPSEVKEEMNSVEVKEEAAIEVEEAVVKQEPINDDHVTVDWSYIKQEEAGSHSAQSVADVDLKTEPME